MEIYNQFRGLLDQYLPQAANMVGVEMDTATIRQSELQLFQFFNPDVTSLNLEPRNWPMMRLEEALVLVLVYLAFVLVGSTIMKLIFGSKPSPSGGRDLLKPFMLLYNASQVALCAFMIYRAVTVYMEQGYKPFCNAFSLRNSEMASVTWLFYMSKILDFFDTVFIVLRRKWTQLSFLHVYHHSSIFMIYWLNANVAYDGDIYYTVILNSFIHFIMYFYYGVTSIGLRVPTALKRLITHSQRIQFVAMNIQAAILLSQGCAFPKNVTIMYLFYIISLLALFTNFDRKTYGKKDGQKKQKKQQ
ncbi:uncharacterized protein MONBRDRAFT_34679 [Monosiga brevicollis MX1]|uniref:Elongation of fatty acids protein n=1 Tax=Monosiga brevicollis TaxID=81824 RepID=A9VDA7_MONBE|nr:uncharacterized protein MONBRDRAFT_34679 [Monosiga brevicollis MX1]EDQ84522.1 predicted protein [Monosiga brevicollis MX1]|eukprot:XP_001750709.1 hypothetical protein [Monosiga brevicollis MX1]